MQTTNTTTTSALGLSWHNAYTKLRQFISHTPSIEISSNKALIPGDVKEEFYRLFDDVRVSFVKDYCPDVTECGLELSQQYKAVCAGIISEAGFDSIAISADLKWFLENPIDGLIRFLFDPLFKFLAGQIDAKEFEQVASLKITDAFAILFRDGYQRWVALSIIRRLLPDKSYRFPVIDALQDCLMGEGHEVPGQHKDEVPEAKEVRDISFDQHSIVSFVAPRATIHSRRTGNFVALHTDFREAEWTASRRSPDMEWHEIAALKTEYRLLKIRPDLIKKEWYELAPVLPDMALYTAGDVNNLALVSDFKYMLRPEINIAVMESSGWDEKVKLEDLKRRLLALNPRQGAFVICREELSPTAVAAFGNEDGLRLLHVGYDESTLEALASLISPPS